MGKQRWLNGKRVNNRTKFVCYKFTEDGKTVVLFVFENYKACLNQITEDKQRLTKYLCKLITTIQRMRDNKDKWLEQMNRTYNQECTNIEIL